MAVKEVALVQHRRGLSTELPDALEEAEIGLITDTLDVVIGAPGNPLVSGRGKDDTNVYPYENVQILTELSDNLDIIQHNYVSNTSVTAVYPTVITASGAPTTLTAGDTININTIVIDLTTGPSPGTGLDNAISAINAAGVPDLIAINFNGVLRLISTSGNDVSMINVVSTPLQKLALIPGSESGVTFPADSFIKRDAQQVLDDYLSIKAYGVAGDGNQDDSKLINAAFVALYTKSQAEETRRKVFFPAGVYKLDEDAIYFPPNSYLVGEGIDRTVIQRATDNPGLVAQTMDGNGFFSTLLAFSTNSAVQPQRITIEDMTFENLNDQDLMTLTAVTDITFRRCKFKSAGTTGDLFQAPLAGNYTTQSNIHFEDCEFDTGAKGIYINNVIDNIIVKGCTFTGINDECIDFDGTSGDSPVRSSIHENYFDGVSTNSNVVMNIGQFCSDIHMTANRFNVTAAEKKVLNASSTSVSNHREQTAVIANTNTLMFESFPLGTTTDTMIVVDYVIDSINNPRAGQLAIFYDASVSATTALTLSDSNADASAVFTAAMSNPAGSAEVTLDNASTGADVTLRYSYRYNS